MNVESWNRSRTRSCGHSRVCDSCVLGALAVSRQARRKPCCHSGFHSTPDKVDVARKRVISAPFVSDLFDGVDPVFYIKLIRLREFVCDLTPVANVSVI